MRLKHRALVLLPSDSLSQPPRYQLMLLVAWAINLGIIPDSSLSLLLYVKLISRSFQAYVQNTFRILAPLTPPGEASTIPS